MTPKDFYRSYIADDSLSDLSYALLEQVSSYKPVHVLDFGCGSGKHLAPLHHVGVCTIGIDISPLNCAKAIHKYDLPFVACGDETQLRHLCNIDVVMTCSVLDHIPDASSVVVELQRIANRAVVIAEAIDVPEGSQYYYAHDYESMGFVQVGEDWVSPEDGARYRVFKWEKTNGGKI